jgi:hypothetical protein
MCPLSYSRLCASSVKIVLAILLANATIASFGGRRLPIFCNYLPGSLVCVSIYPNRGFGSSIHNAVVK